MYATDSEIYREVPVNVTGTFAVDGRNFAAFIATAGDDVTAEVKGDIVTFTSGGGKISLDIMDIQENDLTGDLHFDAVIPGFKLDDSIFKCIDTNNPKFELNGLFVGRGYVAGTDTRRLGYKKVDTNGQEIIIPKKALEVGYISDIKVGDRIAEFVLNGVRIRTKLIIAQYPDFERIIPQLTKADIKFNGLDVKKKLAKFGEVGIKFKEGTMIFKDMGTNNSFTTSCDYAGNFEIVMRGKHIVGAIESNECILKINANNLPVMLSSGDNDTVIMPITELVAASGITCNPIDGWKYTAPAKTKRVNKDKIIAALEAEIRELKRRLGEC
jgi:DNA polymerase III sliding clamp (beta) subunit (PCNA family)